MTEDRRLQSYRFRVEAAELARDRAHPTHVANGDEQRFASANYAMSFTKGLEHDTDTGLVKEAAHFEAFRTAIDNGLVDPFTLDVPVAADKERAWEAPTAGIVHDLVGPDAQAVTMAPAPALGSAELAYEMAEVYELAVLRDAPLAGFSDDTPSGEVNQSVDRLNKIDYDLTGRDGRARKNVKGKLTPGLAFRGSSPGVETGPYLSQFMLIGNDQPTDPGVNHGRVAYGALQIDQRVPIAVKRNYMESWPDWLAAQNGKNLRCNKTLFGERPDRRFITTPRDLATYVHDDALYEAYLNACLILLGMGTPFDPAFAALSGQGELYQPDAPGEECARPRQAGGFALWGGPHILTLVTEVATRALKAVRFQKFNNHIRLRPEALAARIEKAKAIQKAHPSAGTLFTDLETRIKHTVKAVEKTNAKGTKLLPMAFQEGSPMHPSYGAGHATVAGACVTILKAYFDTDTVLVRRKDAKALPGFKDSFQRHRNGDIAVAYTTNEAGSGLVTVKEPPLLTLEGELNKLAANISIGRNMAGVHYYSDYYDSARMGEAIAIGLLEEQALGYPTDRFVLSVPTFDGGVRRIGRR